MRRRVSRFSAFPFFRAGLLSGFLFLFLAGSALALIFKDLPDPSSFDARVIKQSTKIYDRTGKVLLYEIHGEERRTVIPFEGIPAVVKWATLAAEDADFYSHPAYDLRAIARATLHNLFSRNGSLQGGSTITQQLVKNSFFKPERTLRRKIRELIVAVRFEKRYTKDQIFEFYLNQIPYGSNAYGIEAASQTFFAKPAKELALEEAALLTALPRAPTYYSPYGSRVKELKKRQEYILDRMVHLGYISKESAETAKGKRLTFAPQTYGIRAPHFVFWVRELLEEKYGPETVENGGLRVITSLDWNAQEIAEKAVREGAAANEKNWQAGNAALVAEDARTGELIAMVGAAGDFNDPPKPEGCEPGVNCKFDPYVNATLRTRQPGSAFKPFVYITAFMKGYTPDTIVFDAPTEFTPNHPKCAPLVDFANDYKDCYHPRNYDEKFRGPVTFRQALAQSLNVPSVKVLYLAGVENSIKTARDLGITTLTEDPGHYGLSLVLGGGGVKLLEMLRAYSVFAQDGMLHKQIAILEVDDAGGRILEKAEPEQKRVLESQYARLINDILSNDQARVPAFQPNGPLTLPGRKVAAKTGTSQDYRDAWTFGYTPSLAAGVWVGNNDNRPMVKGGAGVMASAPIWRAFMEEYLRDTPQEDFIAPEPIAASKPILRGEYMVDRGNGPEIHDLLFWIDKNNPQGLLPEHPENDPQFANWETGTLSWLKENFLDWQRFTQSHPSGAGPAISLVEPTPESALSGDGLRITAKVAAARPLLEVAFFFNDRLVITFDPSPDNLYSAYFIPQNWQSENRIRIEVRDSAGAVAHTSFRVFH